MRPNQLIELIQGERPEANWLISTEGEWGPVDVVAIEDGRVSGHAYARNELDIEIIAAAAHQTGRLMTETWVFVPEVLARAGRHLLPLDIGVRILSSKGRLGIARPATVRRPRLSAWIEALREGERSQLAASLQCDAAPHSIESLGLAKHGEERFRLQVTEIFRSRAAAPIPPRRDFTPLEILRAVRHQFSQEKVVWL